ncbi:MAG TPA: glycosyltransferase [Mycobacteriales bacterium]|nr:glycosyltransferase [Mycobacteriales bacterium]
MTGRLGGVDGVASLGARIDHRGACRRAALRTLLPVLTGRPCPDAGAATLLRLLEEALAGAGPEQFWLALAVLDARLPDHPAVLRAVRAARLDGPLAALHRPLVSRRWGRRAGTRWPTVEIRTHDVLVDVHHTAQSSFATGIQRVARQSALRWTRDHDPVLVGWTPDYTALRRLTEGEARAAVHGASPAPGEPAPGEPVPGARADDHVVVPWRATYVLPELAAEPERARRQLAMAEFSGSATAVIGFDCVPLTTAETTAYGMSGGFAWNLAAVARMDRVAAISTSAATEYRGWRQMLPGAGLRGPDITPIPLPVEADDPSAEVLAEARELLGSGDLPMVLVVGSHEPRKNHLAVLHAAELLWRDGVRFTVTFVGGNSWNSERFFARVAELQARRRPVQSLSALPDRLLWAAYRLARCTVFPSLNEGFGLPVAESLASGTPVITSAFGSMLELAAGGHGAGGGALLVDPRDDHDLARALRRLLTDDELHGRLSQEAQALPVRTWDQYAHEAWQYLVDGVQPKGPDEATAAPGGT